MFRNPKVWYLIWIFNCFNGFNFLGANISSTMPASSLHPVLQFRGLNFEEELDEYQETSTNRSNMLNSKSMFNESPVVDNLILQRSRNNSNDRYYTKPSKVMNDDEVIISYFLCDWVDVPSYLRYNHHFFSHLGSNLCNWEFIFGFFWF